ncbi:glycosyl hydrolase [Tritrichomonas foetus]|uniref:Glucosidase II subunit alpha n=1 Tax=Tritrichomonas foetus TaxID=1144522 RepID=A0A1J4KZU6_9EUKA|nr:glycosyl hydrolase [Tritrichomonas foetus]|eukprot:OHT16775.1 glycosyl hydrolase [Tritrichomonas foetus]
MVNLLFLLLATIIADNPFNSCNNVPFCRRNFNFTANYSIDINSIIFNQTHFIADLTEFNEPTNVSIMISSPKHQSIRIKTNIKNHEKNRYDISSESCIINQNTFGEFEKLSMNKYIKYFELSSQLLNIIIKIYVDPFWIEFEKNRETILEFNKNSQFIFENPENRKSSFFHEKIKKASTPKFPLNGKSLLNDESLLHDESLLNGKSLLHDESLLNDDFSLNEGDDSFTSVGCDFSFGKNDFYFSGLGGNTQSFNIDGQIYRLYNYDSYKHYSSNPFIIAHSTKHQIGIFWANPSDTFVQVTEDSSLRFLSETGFIDVYLFFGNFNSIIQKFTSLTGRPFFPPIFSLGYHQCRSSYHSQDEVTKVMQSLESAKVPFDSIWLGTDHLANNAAFGFNSTTFPEPKKLIGQVLTSDRYLIRLSDPYLPSNVQHRQYNDAKKLNYFVNMSDGVSPFVANSHAGLSSWPDFLNQKVRDWWASQYQYDIDISNTNVFYWIDMNEATIFPILSHKNKLDVEDSGKQTENQNDIANHNFIFTDDKNIADDKNDAKDGNDEDDQNQNNVNENTFPKYVVHNGGFENRDIHNIYGTLMAASTYHGLISRNTQKPNLRPFLVSRSCFSGSQKYAWTITGNNDATWEDLRASLVHVIGSGISGIPFIGSDVGGFSSSPSNELLVRWFQLAAWTSPFFREHSSYLTDYREPYLYTGVIFNAILASINKRYQHLLVWYNAARQANLTGNPIVKPLWAIYPDFEPAHTITDLVVVADTFMLAPIVEENQTIRYVIKPPGRWYCYPGGLEHTETTPYSVTIIDTPIFLAGGKVICVFQKAEESTMQTLKTQNLDMYISMDDDEQAYGEIYFDDGVSFDYLNGSYCKVKVELNRGTIRMTNDGNFDCSSYQIKNIIIFGLSRRPKGIQGYETIHSGSVLKIKIPESDPLSLNTNWKLTAVVYHISQMTLATLIIGFILGIGFITMSITIPIVLYKKLKQKQISTKSADILETGLNNTQKKVHLLNSEEL